MDPPAKIDFGRSSNVWCLYAAIMLAAAILLLNPLVLALVIVSCLRYLRFGRRHDRVLAIGLAALLPLAMMVIERAIITSYQALRPAATQDVAIHEANAELGWQPVPGARARHVGDGNFDVTYEIDVQGRRQTPAGPNAARTLLATRSCSATAWPMVRPRSTWWRTRWAIAPAWSNTVSWATGSSRCSCACVRARTFGPAMR